MPDQKTILLIHPPVSKPCEPPAGLARLAWALKSHRIDCRIYDANLDGLTYLLEHPSGASDTWSRRAAGSVDTNLAALRSKKLYANKDKYKRAVNDINRVVYMAGQQSGVRISLSDYASPDLSPVRSNDLLQSAEQFSANPFFPSFKQGIINLLSQQAPDIIGISVNFMSQAVCAFDMAGFIRKEMPKTRIVLGGGLISSWMKIPGFDNPFSGLIDDLVSGAGEGALLAMCGHAPDPALSFAGFDYSPLPLSQYIAPGLILPYSTSKGCFWQKCKFCPEKTENQGYSPSDKQEVITDIRRLATETKPMLIHFLDNALSPGFLNYMIENPPGTSWYGFVRVTDHLADPDFVRALKASGCVMLKLGIESGDQEVLDALDKGIDLQTASRALNVLKDAGISTYVYLLFGTPPENYDSAQKTLAFTLEHARTIDFLNLAVFNLPAYGEDARNLQTINFYEGDLSLYKGFVHPKGWDRGRIKKFLAKEFTQPKTIRKILLNDPPYFTSNHAPLMVISDIFGN